MLSTEARDRLAVVLVGARNPQNIGASARAMHDFGFHDLRVVNTFSSPFEAAQLESTSAVSAGEVMRSARIFGALPDAIADCILVAGTTAIGGRGLTQPVLPLQDAAQLLVTDLESAAGASTILEPRSGKDHEPIQAKVALLFGSEKTGLTKEDLSFCSVLLTVPMFAPEGRHLSMNLGQAVAVSLYELTRSGFEGSRTIPTLNQAPPATQDRERVLALLVKAMERSGYARRFPANARTEVVRQLARQLGETPEQAATWMGFLRQILRVLPDALTQMEDADRS